LTFDLNIDSLNKICNDIVDLSPILVEIWCSKDKSCDIVQAFDKLPKRTRKANPSGIFEGLVGFIPVGDVLILEEEKITKNVAILRFSDGSSKVFIKDISLNLSVEIFASGKWLLFDQSDKMVAKYIKFIEEARNEKN